MTTIRRSSLASIIATVGLATVCQGFAAASSSSPAQQVLSDYNAAGTAMNNLLSELQTDARGYGTTSQAKFAQQLLEQSGALVGPLEKEQGALLNVNFTGKTRLDNTLLAVTITAVVFDCGIAYAGGQSLPDFQAWTKELTTDIATYKGQAKAVANDLGYSLK